MDSTEEMTNLSLINIIEKIESGERRSSHSRIISIDGPAGGGKTTLASRISGHYLHESVLTIHMDDLYGGWESALDEQLTRTLLHSIVTPVSFGKNFSYRKYDWLSGRFQSPVELPSPNVLILEGVGSGQKQVRKFLDQLIWIDIDEETGLERVLRRDGDYLETEMRIWQLREREHFNRDNTRDCATIRIDGKYFI